MENIIKMTCIVALVVTTSVWASDMAPPSWRGQPGTTFQVWDFDTDANPASPNLSDNAYGTASADVLVGMFGSGWCEDLGFGPVTGYWDMAEGSMALSVPNASTPSTYQDVWVQVTYYEAINQAPIVTVPGGQFMGDQTLLFQSDPPFGGWFVNQSLWRIEPNPGSVQVVLTGDPMYGAIIDQVVIDTMVPEPASILFVGLAAGFVLRRRRA